MSGDFRPSSGRGQNFLVDPNLVRKFVDLLDPGPEDTVLEVGAGKGALTDALLERGCRVVAVEVQDQLAAGLRERALPGLVLHHADFLTMDPEDLALPEGALALSNVPYSITGPVLTRLLSGELPLSRVVVGLQDEVAERLVAGPGSRTYGSLSVLAAAFGRARRGFKVPASCYRPRPKVASRAVLVERDEAREPMASGGPLERMVRAAFTLRRKTLRNSLAHGLGRSKEEVEALLGRAQIEAGRRAESLSLAEFRALVAADHRGTGPSTVR